LTYTLCLHLNCLIVIITKISMSSDYSLSPPPASPEPELPVLPSSSHQSRDSTPSILSTRSSTKTADIPKTNAYVFTAGLFKRTKLATTPSSVLYSCTQPGCTYQTTMLSHRVLSTGNLLKHYHGRHKGVPTSHDEAKKLTINPAKPDFFCKYDTGLGHEKARKLALDLVVSNNLKLGLVESPSFRAFVAAHNPYVFIYIYHNYLNSNSL